MLQVLMSQWLGASTAEAMLLSKMSEVMRKDVDKALAEAPAGKPQPSRFTRKEAAAREAAQVGAGAGGGGDHRPGAPQGQLRRNAHHRLRSVGAACLLIEGDGITGGTAPWEFSWAAA